VFGLLVLVVARMLDPSMRGVIAGDAFFGGYLLSSWWVGRRYTPDRMRERARYEDEGMIVIWVVTLAAVSLSVVAIFALLSERGKPDLFSLLLVMASVLLSWLTLHTVFAFRYAHLYYAPAPDGSRTARDSAGLIFPGSQEPGAWDFIYFSLVIGMTSQVSDVQVCSTELRRLTLAHSVTAFFFNTTIIALAVNIGAGLAQ